jgi:peptide subunit release factor 1 (eRF1)
LCCSIFLFELLLTCPQGIDDTLKALELGAVETLIVFENLEVTRYVLKDSTGAQHILSLTKQQETAGRDQFMDKETGQEMEIVSQESFLEWIAEHYKARSPPLPPRRVPQSFIPGR